MHQTSRLSFRANRGAETSRRDGGVEKIRILDIVRLDRAHPEAGVHQGATGTVVEIFERPQPAYEVEFLDEDGEFVAQIPVSPDDLSLIEHMKPEAT